MNTNKFISFHIGLRSKIQLITSPSTYDKFFSGDRHSTVKNITMAKLALHICLPFDVAQYLLCYRRQNTRMGYSIIWFSWRWRWFISRWCWWITEINMSAPLYPTIWIDMHTPIYIQYKVIFTTSISGNWWLIAISSHFKDILIGKRYCLFVQTCEAAVNIFKKKFFKNIFYGESSPKIFK